MADRIASSNVVDNNSSSSSNMTSSLPPLPPTSSSSSNMPIVSHKEHLQRTTRDQAMLISMLVDASQATEETKAFQKMMLKKRSSFTLKKKLASTMSSTTNTGSSLLGAGGRRLSGSGVGNTGKTFDDMVDDLAGQLPAPQQLSQELLASTEYADYLEHLTSSSYESLLREPSMLTEQYLEIKSQLSDLAYKEYPSFLFCAECARDVRSSFQHIEQHLDELLEEKLDAFEKTCTELPSVAEPIFEERAKVNAILEAYPTLMELLEVPQLVDTFIRNGYYEEAMDLQTHIQRLLIRYPSLRLVKRIGEEVNELTGVMLSQLLTLLQGNIKLPLCIRVIGYLRRMEAFSETELRVVFLRERERYLQKMIADVQKETKDSSAEYLKKYVDVSREHFFDTITQYKAIFSDTLSTGISSGPSSTSPSSSSLSASMSKSSPDGSLDNYAPHILPSYVSHFITNFTSAFSTHLPNIKDTSTLSSLLTSSLYFGMSLGRVGVDFRTVIADLFVDRIAAIFKAHVSEGVDSCILHFQRQGLAQSVVPSSSSSTVSSVLPTSAASTTIQPPYALVSYPPLAWTLNAFLTAYNSLRVVPAVTLYEPLSSFLISEMDRLVSALLGLAKPHWDPAAHDDAKLFVDLCQAFMEFFVPSVVNGFEEGVFGSVSSGMVKGRVNGWVEKVRNVTSSLSKSS